MAHPQLSLQPEPAVGAPGTVWPLWPLRTLLAVLFLGPLIAPLFQATHLPLLADSGALAHDVLSYYVCPTPAKSYVLAGFPMAVCARCWGATIGLWLAWFVFRRAHAQVGTHKAAPILGLVRAFTRLPLVVRVLLCSLPFLLWTLEIVAWPTAPLGILLLNGVQAGFWAGLGICSIWPGLAASLSVLPSKGSV